MYYADSVRFTQCVWDEMEFFFGFVSSSFLDLDENRTGEKKEEERIPDHLQIGKADVLEHFCNQDV